MLIKIGNHFVEPAEIAAFGGEFADVDGTHYIEITLRQAAEPLLVEATMDEAEAALIDEGFIEAPYETEPGQALTDEELEKLLDLDARGYEWLARDRDGKLFAFRNKPALSGAYWEAPRDPHPERIGGFDFVADDDDAPTEIRSLLGYPY